MSPALIIQAAILVVGGLAIYWNTIAEIRAALAESKTNRAELALRITKLETAADSCLGARFRVDGHEKSIGDIQKEMKELEQHLREHDETTRKMLPLGRRSELEPLHIN